MKAAQKQPSSQSSERGSTLIELALGVMVMSVVFAGTLSAFVQSRRMTEGSIFQNSATTVVQGYLEQIKNIEFNDIPYYSGTTLMRGTIPSGDDTIYTQLDSETLDVLRISSGSPVNPATVTPGIVPAVEGLVDNFKAIDINDTPDDTRDDLIMHFWIWVNPLENAATGVARSHSIKIVYSWSFNNGGIARTEVSSIATIRSVVPTF